MKRREFLTGGALSLAGVLVATSGCTTTGAAAADPAAANAAERREIDADVDEALSRLYRTVNGSRELLAKARGVLVFPDVMAAGFVVGAEYGRGALRVEGRTIGYFTTIGGSFGAQVGAQSRAIVYAFMTRTSLDHFKRSSGWTAGADATVALVKMGANGMIDTHTAVNPIEAFVLTNAGLMAGVSLAGSKVSRLDI
jgi:lipid-binding SYLF domain-containing protein